MFGMSDYDGNSLVTYPNFQTALKIRIAGGKTGRKGSSVQSTQPGNS